MLSLFWLLLPVAAASGWYLAKREYQKLEDVSHYQLPQEYYMGLNHILNDQPDKAIDLFLKLSETNPSVVEIQLALGSLFRRRGEVDRAIRLHQGLLRSRNLSNHTYRQSLHELALDYMSAGLLDRAENACLELIDIDGCNLAALQILQDIYQQEKEWFRAIEVARKAMSYGVKNQSQVIAHYYCELAGEAHKVGDINQAIRMLERALLEDDSSARAIIMWGDIEHELGHFSVAIFQYKKLEKCSPEYLSEALPALQACYEALGETIGLMEYIEAVTHKSHAVDLVLAAAVIIRKHVGEAEKQRFLTRKVAENPSLRGVLSLLDMDLRGDEYTSPVHIRVIKESLDRLLINKPVYRCIGCGFTGMGMHWCCPGCKRWSSVKTIQEFQWGASI